MRRFFRELTRPAALRHAAKTALAAVATLAVVQAFGLPQGYWAVITAIIVMQAHFGGSIRAGLVRLVGTAVGAASGAALAAALGNGPVALAAAVFLTILFCAAMPPLREASRVAGITAAIIVLLADDPGQAHLTALTRFAEIGLGILAALAVSLLVWPSRARGEFKLALSRTLDTVADVVDLAVIEGLGGQARRAELAEARERLAGLMDRNRELSREAASEWRDGRREADLEAVLRQVERLLEHLPVLDHAAPDHDPDGPRGLQAGEIQELARRVESLLAESSAHLERGVPIMGRQGLERAATRVRNGLLEKRPARISAGYDPRTTMHFYIFIHALLAAAAAVGDIAAILSANADRGRD